jgi:hypothetical protein
VTRSPRSPRSERHLDLAAVERPRDVEADPFEDADHGGVVGEHLADEPIDPVRRCGGGEPLEQPRRDPSTLERVGDGEGDLGRPRIAQAYVVGERDDPILAVLRNRTDQRPALRPVGVEHRLHEVLVHRGVAMEAEVEATRRALLEEAQERSPILLRRRTQPQRAPVAQDDVDGSGVNVGRGHEPSLPLPGTPVRRRHAEWTAERPQCACARPRMQSQLDFADGDGMDARTLQASRRRLAELRREGIQQLAVGAAAVVGSLVLTVAYRPLVMPLFLGGVAVGALAMRSLWRHWDLVDRLADDRDAHVLPEVAAYAARHGRVDDKS